MEAQKSLSEDRSLWVLIVLALVLVLGYYGWQTWGPTGNQAPEWVLEGLDPSRVTRIERTEDDQVAWQITQQDKNWKITNPSGIRVDTGSIETLIDSLSGVSPEDRFAARSGENYASQSSPSLEVELANQTHRLTLGHQSPAGTGRYVIHGGDTDQVYLLSQSEYGDLDRGLYDLRQTSLVEFSPSSIQEVTLTTGSSSTTYQRENNAWNVAGDALSDTDTQTLETALQELSNLRADEFYDQEPDRFDPPRGTVKLTTDQRTVRLYMGSTRDDRRLLTLEGWPRMKVNNDPAALVQDLPRRPDDWPEPVESPTPGAGGTTQLPGNLPNMENLNQE